MIFGSLFSGIGGFDLGLERAGMRCAWQVEIDSFCQKVLKKHWPDVPKYEDVRYVGKHNLASVDLIAGGFPCQPHSYAGKRRGAADDRNLWPEYLRIIEELRPAWVIGENVPGIKATILDQVLSDLESVEYETRSFIIPACAFNAPHIRERVFIIANAQSVGQGTRRAEPERQQRQTIIDGNCSFLADSESEGLEEWWDGQGEDQSQNRQKEKSGGDRPARCGYAEDGRENNHWSAEPSVGGAIDGFPSWLDGNRGLTIKSHKCILSYVIRHNQGVHNANAAQNRGREVLQKLQRETGKESIQRTAGGFGGVSAEEVLLTYLRKLEEASEELDYFSLESEEIQEGSLRGVQWENEPTGSPHRPESRKQRTGEFADSLQALSRLLAHHSQKAWAVYRRENASAILNGWLPGWEDGFNRVAHGVPNRVDRLKSLGNAVVPQVAEWIGRKIMEVEG